MLRRLLSRPSGSDTVACGRNGSGPPRCQSHVGAIDINPGHALGVWAPDRGLGYFVQMSAPSNHPTLFAFLSAVTLGLAGACEAPPPPPTAAPPPVAVPDVVPVIRSYYEGYVAAPGRFDRLPTLSAYYISEGRKLDERCRAGDALVHCQGDRFACQALPPKRAGQVVSARKTGEQPGASATVELVVRFGKTDSTLVVDAVVEGGTWKIDQVRCAG